jgi:hypothetical protein
VSRLERASWWAAASQPWMARRIGACVLALLGACGSLTGMTTVHASSDGAIILSPPTAAAGMQVSADVRIFAPPAQDFVLKATTTAPGQGGCASAIPISGAPAFSAGGPAGGHVTFPWPASLGTNMYWLCAFPAAGGSDQAWSEPYIVTQDAAPALHVTPGLALPGSTLQVTIADWLASNHQAPAHLWISYPSTSSEVAFQVLSPPDANGACTLSLVLPLTLSPGDVFLIAGSSAYYQRSDTITVEEPALATAAAAMTASPTATPAVSTTPSVSPTSYNATLFFGLSTGVLLLLLLVVGGIVLLVVRRRP